MKNKNPLPRLALASMLLAPSLQAQLTADVWRDENGVPHIQATTEQGAWYALGYEEARDSLIHIRFNHKIWTGQATKYVGDVATYVYSDFLMQLTGADKRALDVDPDNLIRPLLEVDGANADQLYDNLEAYVAGINAFIEDYSQTTPGPNDRIRQWIDANHPWMLVPDVTLGEVVSFGTAEKVLGQSRLVGREPTFPGIFNQKFGRPTTPAPACVQADKGTNAAPDPAWLTALNENGAGGAIGSNSFQWTHAYTAEPDGSLWAGSVADPHWSRTAYAGVDPATQGPVRSVDHVWFAHVKVVDNGVTSMDSMGWIRNGSGVFFLSHNENVATGGSLGAPNVADAFVLRTQWNGSQLEYWSNYAQGWLAFEDVWIDVDLPASDPAGTQRIHYKQTQQEGPGGEGKSYGYVLDDTPRLLPGIVNPCTGVVETFEYVIAHRLPADPRVDGVADETVRENHHARLNVAWYEAMRAQNAVSVYNEVKTHDAGFLVGYQTLDRFGNIFGTTLGTIPRRGDDDALDLREYNTASKGQALQSFAVSAVFPCDEDFDWVWSGRSPEYLKIDFPIPALGKYSEFWPYVFYSHTNAAQQPPRTILQGEIENPGFVSINNDFIYNVWNKRSTVVETDPDPLCPTPTTGRPWVGTMSPDNLLLDQMHQAGTLYAEGAQSLEANVRNQLVYDQLMPIALELYGINATNTPSLSASMTIDESKDFAMSNRWYAATDYPDASVASLPVMVRVLQELHQSYASGSLAAEYTEEAAFFKDLWGALHAAPTAGTNFSTWRSFKIGGADVDLQDVWIHGTQDPFLLQLGEEGYSRVPVEMPAGVGLIDFHPKETFQWVGVDTPKAFTTNEEIELASLMGLLTAWDGPEPYANHIDSTAAALLSVYKMGLQSGSRRWTALEVLPVGNGSRAHVAVGSSELDDCPTAFVALSSNGAVPLSGGDEILPQLLPYTTGNQNSFGEKIFGATNTHTSVLNDPWAPEDTFSGRYFDTEIPYDALYVNGQVKTVITADDVNRIVEFFLELGGFYDPQPGTCPGDPQFDPANNRKEAAFGACSSATCGAGLPNYTNCANTYNANRARIYREGYPYTRALGQVQFLRRLLETAEFLTGQPAGGGGLLPAFGDLFRTRVTDITGARVWPDPNAVVNDPWLDTTVACTGGFLRSVGIYPQYAKCTEEVEGFSRQILCLGGSGQPLVTFFPWNQPGTRAKSFFWNVPGQNIMDGGFALSASGQPKTPFENQIEAYVNNELLDTHFHDYPPVNVPPDLTHSYQP